MSKRFNLSVDIDDDSLFEKSVKNSITAYVKQQVRQSFQEEIQGELERLVKTYSKIEGSGWNPTKRFIVQSIKDSLNSRMNNYLLSTEFRNILEDYINDILSRINLESMVIKALGPKISNILDKIINEMVEKKSNG